MLSISFYIIFCITYIQSMSISPHIVQVLSRFRHPNLVILMGFARNGRERYLVYELLPGGDVHSRLNKDARPWEDIHDIYDISITII